MMKHLILTIAFVIGMALSARAESSKATAGSQESSAPQIQKQSNASGTTGDTREISGDQVTKPAGAKNSAVIGCLEGPDIDGRFVLRSMQYRSGVEVLGPDDLVSVVGKKIRLTGSWVAVGTGSEAAVKQTRKFQVSSLDVLAEKCSAPTETTPISKKKQQEKAAEQKERAAQQEGASSSSQKPK